MIDVQLSDRCVRIYRKTSKPGGPSNLILEVFETVQGTIVEDSVCFLMIGEPGDEPGSIARLSDWLAFRRSEADILGRLRALGCRGL